MPPVSWVLSVLKQGISVSYMYKRYNSLWYIWIALCAWILWMPHAFVTLTCWLLFSSFFFTLERLLSFSLQNATSPVTSIQPMPKPDGMQIERLQCPHCCRSYASLSGYRNHIRIHMGQYRYICDICGRGFMQNSHYDGHMNQHYQRRPYKCPVCGSTHGTKNNAQKCRKKCAPKINKSASCENS